MSQPETPRLPISTPINHNSTLTAYIPKKSNSPPTSTRHQHSDSKFGADAKTAENCCERHTQEHSATSISTPTPPRHTHHHNPRQRSHPAPFLYQNSKNPRGRHPHHSLPPRRTLRTPPRRNSRTARPHALPLLPNSPPLRVLPILPAPPR
jgi:hypothetical protein